MRVVRLILIALCLALCGGTVALWYRSHRVGDIYVWESFRIPGRHYEVATIPGQVRFTIADGWINAQGLRHDPGVISPFYPVFGHQRLVDHWYPPGFHTHAGTSLISTIALGPSYQYSIRVTHRIWAVPYAL